MNESEEQALIEKTAQAARRLAEQLDRDGADLAGDATGRAAAGKAAAAVRGVLLQLQSNRAEGQK
jgi:hypothetical protein